jgi:DNA-binding GntR family transcriptional regulator
VAVQPERARDVTGIRPVAARSLVELVLDEIRRSLLEGSLVPGASFSIAELSDRLGVSHIPVREALRRVEAEGLIELRHGRSARVMPMSREDLTEIFRLRALVEADAMARAVRLYTPDDLAAIQQAYDALLIGPDEQPEEIFIRHRGFHELLVQPAAGAWDRRLHEMLSRAGDRYVAFLIRERDLAEAPETLRGLHRRLLEAATSGCPEQAREAVHEHLETAVDLIAGLLAGT